MKEMYPKINHFYLWLVVLPKKKINIFFTLLLDDFNPSTRRVERGRMIISRNKEFRAPIPGLRRETLSPKTTSGVVRSLCLSFNCVHSE